MAPPPDFHHPPGWFTRHVFNPVVVGLTRLGVSFAGSSNLRVRGRKSGEWRQTPVNPVSLDSARYLVAPRGDTQWVRNLRAAGEGELQVGRRRQAFRAVEVPEGPEKLRVLRAYLERWAWEVGAFFGGVGADADDEALARESTRHPVFRIDGAA
jgi:deazaflavin-dependent oxidoreductase (nitroreductase family)